MYQILVVGRASSVEVSGYVECNAIKPRGDYSNPTIGSDHALHVKKAEPGEHIPSSKLTLVFVLPKAVSPSRRAAVEFVHNTPNIVLRQIRTSDKVKEPCCMQIGLIAVIVP